MKPVHFEQMNRILARPPNMTEEQCASLPIFTDGTVCVSCWEPTIEELAELARTGRVYLLVHSGYTQPPVRLTTLLPFEPVTEAPRLPEKEDHGQEEVRAP